MYCFLPVWGMTILHGLFVICYIIVIILGISFMQGIYTYIPETNHFPIEHCVATHNITLLLYLFLQINNDIVGVGISLNVGAGCCLYTVISILLHKG
jgi:hypothetical protein